MDRRIRALAFFLVCCFVLLVVQLNNLQVRQASSLSALGCAKGYVHCAAVDPFTEPRGDIVSADGVVLARSTPTNDGYGEQRSYPEGPLFADITGYYDVVDTAATGIEAEYDSYLRYHQASPTNLRDLLTSQSGTDTVVLTVSNQLQQDAAHALASQCVGQPGGCHEGAVVALDPRTGAILAMYGLPTFNPNLLSSHDAAAVRAAYRRLANPPGGPGASPLINFATAQTYPPGSTFKVITTSAIFDHDPLLATVVWPDQAAIHLPETNLTLGNFAGETCGGDLAVSLAVSCDTAYAQIGMRLGAANLHAEAEAFGLNTKAPIDLPPSEVATTCFPGVQGGGGTGAGCPSGLANEIGPRNIPGIAYSAIGQEDVAETALEDALVVGAIGDDGTIMTPHLMARIISDTGRVVTTYHDHPWRRATSAATATKVRELMRGVAEYGTAAADFPASLHVAAKTGTSQVGTSGCSANWMVATAPAGRGQTPTVAVAAVVPYQPGLTCGDQGATVAGPVVSTVLQDALALQQHVGKGSS